jgi:ATP-dependent RNA helicase DeaD
MTFNEMGLSEEILRAITEMGFVSPTPIQEKTLPQILESKNDLVSLAQTGTGKTAAFGLPIIQLSDIQERAVQTLILCPTRELGLQITKDLQTFSKYTKGFKVVPVYGGAAIYNQIKDLKNGAHVVVGTPGRTLDLIKRKALNLENIRWMILDEADEMLNMGFKDDLDSILAGTPASRQTLLFSATMPKEIERIASSYMNNPDKLSVGVRNAGAENVVHEYYVVNARDRYEALKRLADDNPNIYGIVFCRTRAETKDVADKLMQDGYNADALHGDLSQAQRDFVMNRFRQKHLQMLVATDVAARGIDINDLTHVINYNLPDDSEVYVHRSGRTGRAGKNGISLSIVHSREVNKVRTLESMTRKKFNKKLVPTGSQICEKQLFNLVERVEQIEVDNHQIEQYLPDIYAKLEYLERDELIKHFVSVEFNRFLAYYKNAKDLNVSVGRDENRRGERSERGQRGARIERGERGDRSGSRYGNTKFSRFHINIGSKDNINPPNLIGIINDATPGLKVEIGKIDILRNFSFFDADSTYEQEILKSFKNQSRGELELAVTLSKGKAESDNREKRRNSDFGDRRAKPRYNDENSGNKKRRTRKRI